VISAWFREHASRASPGSKSSWRHRVGLCRCYSWKIDFSDPKSHYKFSLQQLILIQIIQSRPQVAINNHGTRDTCRNSFRRNIALKPIRFNVCGAYCPGETLYKFPPTLDEQNRQCWAGNVRRINQTITLLWRKPPGGKATDQRRRPPLTGAAEWRHDVTQHRAKFVVGTWPVRAGQSVVA